MAATEWKLWGCINGGPFILITRGSQAHCIREREARRTPAYSDLLIRKADTGRPSEAERLGVQA